MKKSLRVGTRASPLARWQASWVGERLGELGRAVELVPITTEGDAQPAGPVRQFHAPGMFTKAIQQSLLAHEIDLAVHSLKDLPTDPIPGLRLAAISERQAVSDVLVSRGGNLLEQLPHGASVGTGSFRRRAQLLHLRADLNVVDVRGNVGSRLQKVIDGQYEAVVLAQAGLIRLGLEHRITQVFSPTSIVPAVGQGALGIEVRSDDQMTAEALAPLDHLPTRHAVIAERQLLATLDGGCLAPVGAWGRIEDERLTLSAVVLSHDGRQRLEHAATAEPARAQPLGQQVAEALIVQGASELIRATRECHG